MRALIGIALGLIACIRLQAQNFHTIKVSGLAVVHYTQGNATNIVTKVSGMPQKDVITKVENGVLLITTQGQHNGESIDIQVTNPGIHTVDVGGTSQFYSRGVIQADHLKIAVHHVGAAKVKVDVKQLNIYMNGGDLDITGVAQRQKIKRSRRSERGTLKDENLKIMEDK